MDTLVELVRAGFHGLALAILLLGFCLLRKVVDANTGKEAEKRDFAPLLHHIRCFLIISLVFLVVGASLEVLRLWLVPETEVNFTLTPELPEEIQKAPELVAGTEVYAMSGTPQPVKLKDRQGLLIRVDGLCETIRHRDLLLRDLRAEQGEQSNEIGL